MKSIPHTYIVVLISIRGRAVGKVGMYKTYTASPVGKYLQPFGCTLLLLRYIDGRT